MTTIAYHHEHQSISVDGRLTQDNFILTDDHDKTAKNEQGFWFFMGDIIFKDEFVSLESGQEMPSHREDSSVSSEVGAILVSGGIVYSVYLLNGRQRRERLSTNEAIGSGSSYAIAAMDFGKNSKEAVRYAAQRDNKTGPNVSTYKVTNDSVRPC
ncbi:hypothetical protein F9L16_15925 [Agarivorans sp. B2Z047]|uniref:hypothetical protein n=1 Tax=Agarivorans sp. B2Z047 TaxID=2652721 RepID=UPI00128BF391|nr:hypothetical protein [Agarivorans sp. B2Z047]MPW30475.1 hypothetical protein [Agarivorans sp. B2Z047]UQN42305.1 hypothetical protein LQZ07_21420 [Agarivorans sp. B2Z047]